MTYPPRDPAEHDEPVHLARTLDDRAAEHPLPEIEGPEPEIEEYDLGDAVDDEGSMSEYRHYPEWAEIERAEYEAGR